MRAVTAFAGFAALCATAAVAAAHVAPSPRENNRYYKLTALGDRVRIAYTVFFGELPGQKARARLDQDGDRVLSDAELEPLAAEVAGWVEPRVEVHVDGEPAPVHWSERHVGAGTPRVDAGALSVDLVGWVCLDPARREHRVRFFDRAVIPVPGETELYAEASPGVQVTAAGLGAEPEGVRLQAGWTGGAGPAADDGYALAVRVDPALAAIPPEPCGAPAAADTEAPEPVRWPWWLALAAAAAAITATALAFGRRRG